MPNEKNINSRIQLKYDVETNWNTAASNSSFIPKKGEVIIYAPDENYSYPRIKIGDGETLVSELAFITDDGTYRITGTYSIDKATGEPVSVVLSDNFDYSDMNIAVSENKEVIAFLVDESGDDYLMMRLQRSYHGDQYAVFSCYESDTLWELIIYGLSHNAQLHVTYNYSSSVTVATDKTLQVEDAPADAKAVGDALAAKSSIQIITWEEND